MAANLIISKDVLMTLLSSSVLPSLAKVQGFVSSIYLFVLEIISNQIKDTIDKEEEMEAWREMSDFFGEQFEIIILEIQTKYSDDKNFFDAEIDPQKQRLELLERINLDEEKKDMWDD